MELHEYQKVGVKVLLDKRKFILADDMGLGKSVQALMALKEGNAKRILIVCPKTVKIVWKKEIEKWLGIKDICVLEGTAETRTKILKSTKAKFIVVNYEQMRIHVALLVKMGFDSVVFDEAHRLKNPKARLFKNAAILCRHVVPEFLFLLSGTPMSNKSQELWTLLHLTEPDTFKNYYQFCNKYLKRDIQFYGKVKVVKFSEPDDPTELRKILVPRMLRRERWDVLDLPDLVETQVDVRLTGKQQRFYDEMSASFVTWLNNKQLVVAYEVISQIMRLKQFCVSPWLVDTYRYEDPQGAKIDWIMDWLDDTEPTRKVVVFSQFASLLPKFRDLINNNAKGQYTAEIITGEVNFAQRLSAVDRFQQPGSSLRVLLCSLTAGGEGITLTEGDAVIFLDRHWNPQVNEQAIARVHRQGQKKRVFVYTLVCNGTIEERIEHVLALKLASISATLPTTEILSLIIGHRDA